MSSPLTGLTPLAIPALAGLPPLDLCGSARWYAVHSQPSAETRASLQLGNQGFRTFMPKRRKTVRHARQTKNVIAPLFPRYFFVALDLTRDQWRCVNGTFGVSRLVMGGELPHPVPRGVIEGLIASTDSDGFLNLAENLKPGSAVRLTTGPLPSNSRSSSISMMPAACRCCWISSAVRSASPRRGTTCCRSRNGSD